MRHRDCWHAEELMMAFPLMLLSIAISNGYVYLRYFM
jgi:hypothetical protein